MKKVQKIIESLDYEALYPHVSDFEGISADERFGEGISNDDIDSLAFDGDDWEPTDRESGYLDENGKMIYDGTVVAVRDFGIFRVAYHVGKWYCLSGMIAMSLEEVATQHKMLSMDDNEQMLRQAITKSEWLFDNGPRL